MSETSVRGDLEWGTTPRLLHSSAERFSAREAIVDVSDGRTLSFAGLATAVHDAARAFLAMGIERGDRVAIWAPNVWEWVVAALGLHSAGAVLVPLNTRFKGREAAYILGKSRAKALVTITGFLDTDYVSLLREAVDVDTELPDLEAIVVLRGDAPEGTRSWAEFMAAGSAVDSDARRCPRAGGRARRLVRHPLHLGYDREPQGRDAHARARRCARTATGAKSSVSRSTTGT